MQRPDIDTLVIEHLEKRTAALEASNAALIANLETAVQSIQHWGECAPKHFREKHHFDDELRGWQATIADAKKGVGND